MNPEMSSSGPSTDAFAEMAASMPSYGEHIASQVGPTPAPDSPPAPAPNLAPAGESTPADNPPMATGTEAAETTETAAATETAKTATEATPETSPDFSPEELAGVKEYADQLENGAKKDLKLADLLHQFVDSASHQRSVAHQMSAPSATSATAPKSATISESSPSSATPDTSQNAANQPETAPKPTIPDAATAIAEALAETADHPTPGQTPIATPPESTTGEYPVAA